MNFALSEEQLALKESAQRFLAEHASSERTRQAMATEAGFDPDTWRAIAEELGWTAAVLPEAHGGLGLDRVALGVLMEEMGRALLCAPFFSSICLGATAIMEAGTEAQQRRWLSALAEGSRRATLAFNEAGGWDAGEIRCALLNDGDSFRLEGTKRFVIDGHTADLLVVAARTPGSHGPDGVSLVVVPADAAGVTRRHTPTMDQTRKLAEVRLDGVQVPADACLGGPGGAWVALRRTLDLAAVALAAEQVGGAERCLDMAVEYASVRTQFGRPIGSFQAIKHMCADTLTALESARSASLWASWVASAEPVRLGEAAAIAQTTCSRSFFLAAAQNIQIHGGIGFTWEHDAHLFFKRAQATEKLLGTPDDHLARVAEQVLSSPVDGDSG